jgi:hypothetical protein
MEILMLLLPIPSSCREVMYMRGLWSQRSVLENGTEVSDYFYY